MNWFRKHLKHGSRLALFALAIQFALSFGHFHGVAAQAAPAIQTNVTDADFAYAAASPRRRRPTRSRRSSSHRRPIPTSNRRTPARSAPSCRWPATCCSQTPPLLQLPQAVEFLYLTTDAEFVHLGSVHFAFQSRAPPAS